MPRMSRGPMILLVGAMLAAACVTAAAVSAGTGAHTASRTLVVALTRGEPDALDPSTTNAFSTVEVLRTICERLYDWDAKGRVVPELASALPTVSPDGLTYTIPLRQGVRFNDGTPFDAAAVATTLKRDLTLPGSARASDLTPIESARARSRYTVVVHLKTPFSPLLDTLATNDGIVMSPAQLQKLGSAFGTDPVCVGPFAFANRVPGDSLTVVKSQYYYGRAAIHVDKVVFKVENDATAAIAALEAGDIQAIDQLPATYIGALSRDHAVRVLKEPSLGWVGLGINIGNSNGVGKTPYTNVGTPLAQSPTLRRAFEEAIDRSALVRVVYGGGAVPGCTPVAPASPVYDKSVKCTTYDPADARKLVAASGFPHPTVHLLVQSATVAVQFAQFVQAAEAAVGINVVIDTVDNPTALARTANGAYETSMAAWTGSPAVDRNIYQFVDTDGAHNFGGYSNPRVDTLLDEERQTNDPKRQRSLYRSAFRILLADRPIIYLAHPTAYAAVSAGVQGVQLFSDIQLRVNAAQYH